MNKQGHLLMTGKLMPKDYMPYRRWLLFGSILPDLLFHTYLAGHTWEACFKRTIRGMERLERWGEMSRCSCLCLGFYLHYVEDYFTLPHNQSFRGGFTAHVVYEKRFTQYLMKETGEERQSCEAVQVSSLQDLRDQLENLHMAYMQERQRGFVNDKEYIGKATGYVLNYFDLVFVRNRRILDAARLEAFRVAQEGWLLTGRMEG